ncbi:hypothetical protein Ancab_029295, partial [Ancistrocladus abbreviatus]
MKNAVIVASSKKVGSIKIGGPRFLVLDDNVDRVLAMLSSLMIPANKEAPRFLSQCTDHWLCCPLTLLSPKEMTHHGVGHSFEKPKPLFARPTPIDSTNHGTTPSFNPLLLIVIQSKSNWDPSSPTQWQPFIDISHLYMAITWPLLRPPQTPTPIRAMISTSPVALTCDASKLSASFLMVPKTQDIVHEP